MERLNVTVEECAQILGLGLTRTKRLVQTGAILSFTVGRRRLVPLVAIEEYQQKQLDDAREQRDGHEQRQQRIKRMRQKPAS